MVLEAVNVSMYYGSTPALDRLSFLVKAGEAVGVLGVHGSGKSTAMRVLTGYLTPSHGKVRIMGLDPTLPKARDCFGYLPENNPLPRDMRVREYLLFRAALRGMDRQKARAAVFETAERLSLGDNLESLIHRLGRGARQKVGLAEALLAKPSILILDDPTAGLDPNDSSIMRSLLKSLGASATLFMSSQILREVEELCHRVIVMDRGRVVADSSVEAICENNAEERILMLDIVADEPVREALRAIPGVRTVQVTPGTGERGSSTVRLVTPAGVDLRHEVSRLCSMRGWLITGMRLEPVRLEDIFGKLAKRD